MVKLTFIIGILLLALIFQKNPVWGIFVIGIYILLRFRSRRFNSNKGLIESGKNNTYMTINAMNMGFQTIADAITGQDSDDDFYENDKKPKEYLRKVPVSTNIYRN